MGTYSTGEIERLQEQPVTVLIADDDEVCREVLQDAIEDARVRTAVAADGLEALDALRKQHFDILITDLNMPRMNGLVLLQAARRLHPHLLTIIITGYGSLESAIEAIRQGAYDYVQKPFKIEEIKVPVRNAVEKVRILRERRELLEEIEVLYERLQHAEAGQRNRNAEADGAPVAGGLVSRYFLSHRLSVPLSLRDAPEQDPDRVLVALERLKELKRGQIISEEEFERLKKMFCNTAETDAS